MDHFYLQKMMVSNKNELFVKIIAIFALRYFSERINYQIIARSNTAKKPDNFLAFFFLQLYMVHRLRRISVIRNIDLTKIFYVLYLFYVVASIAYYDTHFAHHHPLPIVPVVFLHLPFVLQ